MGTPMPRKEKNYNRSLILPLFLSITGTILPKKHDSVESSEENTLSFHLEMIKKIDSIIEKHEHGVSAHDFEDHSPIVSRPPPTPIEPRSPLFKAPDHTEISLQQTSKPPQMSPPIQPEEFKTELSVTPEFKFITSREFTDTFLNLRPRADDRIEILDLSSFMDGTILSNKLPGLTFTKLLKKDQPTTLREKEPSPEQHYNKKIEVIDARTLTQKTYEDVFLAAIKQTEDIEKKSQIYYLDSQGYKTQKRKKIDSKQSYIPVDFDERAKEIKEKQRLEREQQLQQEQKQLEREQKKSETKKTKHEEKKQEQSQEQREESKEKPELSKTEPSEKKQQKEQKRLERIEARNKRIEERKKRIEERKRQKEEKRALKEQLKQQRLQQKGKNKKQKPVRGKPALVSMDLDEDVKKILLMTDSLLEELPEDVINKFVQSEDFELYERVMNKYKIYQRVYKSK
jgi:hypothetical protein